MVGAEGRDGLGRVRCAPFPCFCPSANSPRYLAEAFHHRGAHMLAQDPYEALWGPTGPWGLIFVRRFFATFGFPSTVDCCYDTE